jgi:hypothetical protein
MQIYFLGWDFRNAVLHKYSGLLLPDPKPQKALLAFPQHQLTYHLEFSSKTMSFVIMGLQSSFGELAIENFESAELHSTDLNSPYGLQAEAESNDETSSPTTAILPQITSGPSTKSFDQTNEGVSGNLISESSELQAAPPESEQQNTESFREKQAAFEATCKEFCFRYPVKGVNGPETYPGASQLEPLREKLSHLFLEIVHIGIDEEEAIIKDPEHYDPDGVTGVFSRCSSICQAFVDTRNEILAKEQELLGDLTSSLVKKGGRKTASRATSSRLLQKNLPLGSGSAEAKERGPSSLSFRPRGSRRVSIRNRASSRKTESNLCLGIQTTTDEINLAEKSTKSVIDRANSTAGDEEGTFGNKRFAKAFLTVLKATETPLEMTNSAKLAVFPPNSVQISEAAKDTLIVTPSSLINATSDQNVVESPDDDSGIRYNQMTLIIVFVIIGVVLFVSYVVALALFCISIVQRGFWFRASSIERCEPIDKQGED